VAEFLQDLYLSNTLSEEVVVKISKNLVEESAVPALFLLHGVFGVNPFHQLPSYLQACQIYLVSWDTACSVYNSIEQLCDYYADLIIKCFPSGPFYLAGFSAGGLYALWVARSLVAKGHIVKNVILLDSYPIFDVPQIDLPDDLPQDLLSKLNGAFSHLAPLLQTPVTYDGKVTLLHLKGNDAVSKWKSYLPGLETCMLQNDCAHEKLLYEREIQSVVEQLQSHLKQ